MRLWPFRPRSRYVISATPPEDLLALEDLLRRNVEDILVVRERQLRGLSVVFGGELLVSPPRALALLEERFKPYGYTPFLREGGGKGWVQALPPAEGAGTGPVNPFAAPQRLFIGAQFAFTLLSILGTHEFGHYFTARYYGASVSLPYFIPAPPPFIFGTLGAIIKMRSPARDRNSLFDIAVAGPLAGLVVAIPALLLGLSWSRVVAIPPGAALALGDSLLLRLLVYLSFGPIPSGMDVLIHPV